MSEVASAYVSLIPSFRGGASAISNQFGPASKAAGADSGRKFVAGMLGTIAKLGVGSVIAGNFNGAVTANANQGTLAAKLGLSSRDAKTAAGVAGKLYAGAFSDDLAKSLPSRS